MENRRNTRILTGDEVIDSVSGSVYEQRYLERLFEIHPDDELLARMWEMNPGTMSRLMPEIGNESEAEIESEVSRSRSYINFALNSLRVAFGREVKLTPRQRMREAKIKFDDGEYGNYEYKEPSRNLQSDAILDDTEAYTDVAWYTARKEVEAEWEQRLVRAVKHR